jgi:hypothetical protein
VQPVRYVASVRTPHHDVTGLATPAPGTRFAAFLIRMCIKSLYLPTIAPQSFDLRLADGRSAPLKFPETVFADDLDLLGEPGCEHGHIVFQVPHGARPSELRFGLSWSTPSPDGNAATTKVHFAWKI